MDINTFSNIEKKHALFQLEYAGIKIWDVIREPIYTELCFNDINLSSIYGKSFKHHYFKKIFVLLRSLLLLFISSRKKYLIVSTSRFVYKDGKRYDKVLHDTIKILKRDSFVIDVFSTGPYAFKGIYTFDSIFQRIIKTPNLSIDIFERIRDAFMEDIGEFNFSYEKINSIIKRFYAETIFYRFVINKLRSKIVIMDNGSFKAIVKAAQDNKAVPILFQHGEIREDVVSFVYPDNIDKNNIYFPYMLFTFSPLWGMGMSIPAQIVPIGNNYYKINNENNVDGGSVVFISSIYHAPHLKKLAFDFAKKNATIKIYYKLHPEEVNNLSDLREYFSNVENVSVISDEYDTEELVASSNLVVLISSTVLYGVMDLSKKMAIFKRGNYKRNLIFKDAPNVYFVDNENDLYEAYSKKYIIDDRKEFFYDSFNKNKLSDVLNKLNCKES